MTDEFRQRYADGEALDDLLPEAFATVREAAKRTLGQRPFDVQIMGGAAMHFGNIAEMKTGEGKTLAAVLPSYLNALAGNGVHVVTVNDYLAKRDSEWMGRIHRLLGLEVGVILAQMTPEERRKAYAADITYGTNNEFGFDYLRDNMAWSLEDCVQRGHHYAIVDEVDSILIDEARTPLIISGPAEQSGRWYTEFAKIAPRLRRGEDGEGDYEVDEKKRTVGILEIGRGEGRGLPRHREPLRPGQHAAGQLPQQRDQGEGAVQAGQGLRRHERRGPDRGRVHRPDAARPPLQRGHAPGHRGQGRRADPEREPDAGHHHAAELLPPLRQAGRHDRHRHDRGERVPPDLQAGRGPHPDEHADDPGRPGRRRVPDRGGQVRGLRQRHRGASRGRAADAGRHHQRGEVGTAVEDAQAQRGPARGAEREVPRAGGGDRRPGRAQGRGHRGHQHGRPRHRHHAGRQPGVHRGRRAASARPVAGGHAGGLRGGVAGGGGEGAAGGGGRARGGRRGRRAVRARHRAARVAPHRQPAAWPVRPAGRPGGVPLLPVAGRRPDADVQRRQGRALHGVAQDAAGRADRVEGGHPVDPFRADPGRAAELRDPQGRPQVRRRAQPPAAGHLRGAPHRAGGRRPARADPPDDRRGGRRPT